MKSFSEYNPIAIFVFYVCALIPAMFSQNPVLISISLVSGILYYCIKNGRKSYKGAWMLLLPLTGLIVNPLFSHNGANILFFLNNNPITLESALFGLSSGAAIAATLFWLASFTKIMTSDKLLYIFGSVSPKLALILSMTIRYIPLFQKQIEKTNKAQKAMGLYKDDTAIDKIRGGIRVVSVMVTWALENGVITADSMTARGYGIGKRSRFAIFSWRKADYMLLAASLTLGLTSCVPMFSGQLSYTWYPLVCEPSSAIKYISYVCFAILSLIPDYLQIKEEAKWRSLTSVI